MEIVGALIGLAVLVLWIVGLVKLFKKGHTVLGVVGIFIGIVALAGFFVSDRRLAPTV